ncbi:hypothetical protein [Halalkalicoccus salilacus]|uniref:hypothetical protein n=1 Tax=Halalkalicoccus sp. GCM10025704 TaxID=3252662 RepID=UPI0036081160
MGEIEQMVFFLPREQVFHDDEPGVDRKPPRVRSRSGITIDRFYRPVAVDVSEVLVSPPSIMSWVVIPLDVRYP